MTDHTEHVDSQLADGLGPEVTAALRDWAQLHDCYYRFEHWLVNGRSRASVAVVVETDVHKGASAMLVLKVLTVRDGVVRDLEYGRHRRATAQAPAFAKDHLTEFVHEAIPAGQQQWITFQRIAGNTLGNTEVLTVLLRRMLGITAETEPPGTERVNCDPPTFAAVCRNVIGGVLRDWAGEPFISVAGQWSIPAFFHRHIGQQMGPGGRLHDWARRHQGEEIQLTEEGQPLPNPFAVAQGRYFADTTTISPFIGLTHGDLHSDNALVQVRPVLDASMFFLIDTALYEDSGPLTRDPVHFVLYVIARSMETISPAQQGPLIDLLLDPAGGPDQLLPGWLAMLIHQIDAETGGWVRPSGLEQKWRAQTLLSTAACAMLFLGRSSTREIDKPWFLRLAARAAQRFAEIHPGAARASMASRGPGGMREATPRRGDWIGWLCREFPDVRRAAGEQERADEAEQFRVDALGGLDRGEEFREFVRQLGGPDPDVRYGTPGSEGQSEAEQYLCPIGLCARSERRSPGGEVPVCHLSRGGQQRMQSSIG
jgi:hypothetical protein